MTTANNYHGHNDSTCQSPYHSRAGMFHIERNLTMRFGCAERNHSVFATRKMFEKHAIEASAASACSVPVACTSLDAAI
jgi:hypothetical protein